MRKILVLLLIVSTVFSLVMPALAEEAETGHAANEAFEVLTGEALTATDGAVHVKVGQILHITLDGNPTTGYTWVCAWEDAGVFAVIGEGFGSDLAAESNMVGVGGKHHFFLSITAAGESDVTFRYKRTWEDDTEEDKLVVVKIIAE